MFDGIKIYTELDTRDRITLSEGTEMVQVLNNLPASNPTFVPKRSWYTPDTVEQKSILGSVNEVPKYQSIGLYRMPQNLISQWEKMGIHQAETEADINGLMQKADYKQVVLATEQWAATFQKVNEPLITHRLACIPKGLRTVTFNPRENRYLGLHLDSWEKMTLDELSGVRNRLCINLGRDARYFLYMNLEIKQLQSILKLPNQTNARSLIQTFLSQFPDYPVIRVKLKPFEAYIAPTENLIHDGSSEDQEFQDVQITLRSYFKVHPINQGLLRKIKGLFAVR